LLCWTSIPSAGAVPILRLVFVALEATFTFVFWAIKCKTEFGYGMADMCAWARDNLEYDGCCSHNHLSESPIGDLGLSPEQLEAQALELSENRLAYIKEWWQNKTNGPDGAAYKAQVNKARRVYTKKVPKQIRAIEKRHKAKNIKLQKFHCITCDKSFPDKTKLNRHLKTDTHAANAANAANAAKAGESSSGGS
jgi:hypothetical protein